LTGAHVKEGEEAGQGKRGLELALMGSSLLIVPASSVLALGGSEIMSLFGRSYQVNWSVLLPVIAWAAAGAHFTTIGTAFLAHGRQWFLFLQQMIYGGIVVLLTYALRNHGGAGLGLAHLVTSILLILLSIPVLRHLDVLTIRASGIIVTSIIMVCSVCGLAALCPQQWRLLLAIPSASIMFFISWFAFTTNEERADFRQLLTRRLWSASVSVRSED
jgi:hypothetical protein